MIRTSWTFLPWYKRTMLPREILQRINVAIRTRIFMQIHGFTKIRRKSSGTSFAKCDRYDFRNWPFERRFSVVRSKDSPCYCQPPFLFSSAIVPLRKRVSHVRWFSVMQSKIWNLDRKSFLVFVIERALSGLSCTSLLFRVVISLRKASFRLVKLFEFNTWSIVRFSSPNNYFRYNEENRQLKFHRVAKFLDRHSRIVIITAKTKNIKQRPRLWTMRAPPA